MPAVISLCSLLVISLLNASSAWACGLYEVTGVVRKSGEDIRIVVAEGSNSQTVFAATGIIERNRLLTFANLYVKATVSLTRPINGTEAVFDRIESIAPVVPDPLNSAKNELYVRTKQAACQER